MQEGVCIVITPLIALMKDQVYNLRQRGIRAAAIYSGRSHEEIVVTLDNCILGNTKLLYVSPERLSSELFRTKLRHMRVSFITVDEAHCISQWGYDFRPSYLEIADIRKDLPSTPVLALTATATPLVVDDITQKLSSPLSHSAPGKDFNVFRMSFERSNLAYVVRNATDKRGELIHILQRMQGSVIVYVRSRKRTRETAQVISEAGISATFYHAGLDNSVKDERQEAWQKDRIRVMVATNAFGMGIDKPDVRLVVHIDCPDSVEAYFQEAGRAGRDGKKAYAVLLYNNSDHGKLSKRIAENFPEKDYVKQVYEHLAYFYQIGVGSGYHAIFEFNIDKFCHAFHHFPIPVDAALKILTRAGYIEYMEEQDNQARVKFTVSRNDLYRLDDSITPDEERVVTALLRCYGGLFTDFCYIDEGFVASQCQMSLTQLYLILKNLSAKHIIHFIPQKKTPYVRYLQRREDMEHVQLPPAVYEERKNQFAQRIDAMLRYVTTDNVCRSRQLLRYFGEEAVNDCGQCDVCVAHQHESAGEPYLTEAGEKILELLADRKPHPVTDLRALPLSAKEMDTALTYLLQEEQVVMDDGQLTLNVNSS